MAMMIVNAVSLMVDIHFTMQNWASAYSCADDLPVIRDNIKKGFFETQSKVNSWVTNLRKKIDGDDDDAEGHPVPATGFRSGSAQPQYGGRRSGDYQRRSQDQDRYDADPQVLGDDFTGLNLRDTEGNINRTLKERQC